MAEVSDRWLVYVSGNAWDGVWGTDQHLARALSRYRPVLWVDPPWSAARLRPGRRPDREPREVSPGVHRMQVLVPPFGSRFGIRRVARTLVRRSVRAYVLGRGLAVDATVVTSPQLGFPDLPGARRALFVTDDWISGAAMMGLSTAAVGRSVAENLQAADVTAAVSPDLVRRVRSWGSDRVDVQLLPNGVSPARTEAGGPRPPTAGLVGQLNERLDLDLLFGVLDAGVRLRVVGPVTARDPRQQGRIDDLLHDPRVDYAGSVPPGQISSELARMAVGLTPYLDNEFNRSSFPLKTLEYLGAGLAVVATDLPSARWLDCPDVAIASDRDEFVHSVVSAVQAPLDQAAAERRSTFAGRHSWDARARQLLAAVETAAVR